MITRSYVCDQELEDLRIGLHCRTRKHLRTHDRREGFSSPESSYALEEAYGYRAVRRAAQCVRVNDGVVICVG